MPAVIIVDGQAGSQLKRQLALATLFSQFSLVERKSVKCVEMPNKTGGQSLHIGTLHLSWNGSSSYIFRELKFYFSAMFHSSRPDSSFLADKDCWEGLMVHPCTLVGGWKDRFLMRTPYCILDRRRFGIRMVGVLLALSASCVYPLQLHVSLPRSRSHNWLFSLMSANCLGLRPPAVMTDG